jgi:hypothetical protein
MLPSYFVIIGTVIGAIAACGYLLDVLRGTVRPNKVSFFLWSISPFIAFIAEINQGVGLVSIMTLSQSILPFLIFVGSFVNKKSEWKVTKFDLSCGVLSLVGLVLWWITKVGNIAILFSILADGLAALPTIRKAYYHPKTEVAWPWLTTSVGVGLSLLTVTKWNFENYGFPLYLFVCNLLIFFLVQFRKQI